MGLTVDPQVLHALLLRCARQDESAFAEFYRLTSPVVNTWLLSRESSSTGVADAAVWRQADVYAAGPPCSPWAWTLTVVGQVAAAREMA